MAYRPTGFTSVAWMSPALTTGPDGRASPPGGAGLRRWSLQTAHGHSLRRRSKLYTLSWPSCQRTRTSRFSRLTAISLGFVELDGSISLPNGKPTPDPSNGKRTTDNRQPASVAFEFALS